MKQKDFFGLIALIVIIIAFVIAITRDEPKPKADKPTGNINIRVEDLINDENNYQLPDSAPVEPNQDKG